MIVAGIATVINEADIIGISCEHLLASGVDHIYISLMPSTDSTEKILRGIDHVTVIPDDTPYHDQPARTGELAALAASEGANWILPFDADEFIYPVAHESINAAFVSVPEGVNKLVINRWLHRDWNWRHLPCERLPKVAWRTGFPTVCHPGNHDVTIRGGALLDVFRMRELQFRSYEHIARKCQERVRYIDPSFGPERGAHQRYLAALPEDKLKAAWSAMQAIPSVFDPIPVRA